jgi:hypothetical protein
VGISILLPIACGAFIAKTETARFNDALRFVVVRDGTHTTLSVENRYRGPVEDFALLVPVPVVLHEENVRTLDRSVFDKVEEETGPRLEFWEERDPCYVPPKGEGMAGSGGPGGGGSGVSVNAEFQVGEYDVVVLSATEATGLDAWLGANGYKMPPDLAAQVKPYVASGSQFFVAKVDPARVTFSDGRAVLSPLRFDYDADELSLPLRLSAANSPGIQDVLVTVIAPKAFESANRPNLLMPSGFEVTAAAAQDFSGFYAALFDRVMEKHPTAAVTEFASWTYELRGLSEPLGFDQQREWVATRLHLQIAKDGPLDDLVLREAKGLTRYEATYTRRRFWTGAVACAKPEYDVWVPETGYGPGTGAPATFAGKPATDELETLIAEDVPSLDLVAAQKPTRPTPKKAPKSGCGCGTGGDGSTALAIMASVAALGLRPRRARRAPT